MDVLRPTGSCTPRAILTRSPRHGEKVYGRGNVHTNNIENFWSLMKRGVIGTFHNVSAEYLPLYLAEFTFRHNFRGKTICSRV